MYLLFRFKNWEPSKVNNLGENEKKIVKQFMMKEIKERQREVEE